MVARLSSDIEIMNKSGSLLFIGLMLCVLAGCKMAEQESITVAVYPSTQTCAIKEHAVDCAQVGIYLHDTLKIKPDQQVIISFTGSDPGSKDDPILDRIADQVRVAGYRDVRTARFGFQ